MHTAVSNAINASVENFVSPFLEQAADAMDSASDVIERLPSAFLDKAFSKSLDVVTPFERMARWVAAVFRHCCSACHWQHTNVERSNQTLLGFLDKACSKSLDVVTSFEKNG